MSQPSIVHNFSFLSIRSEPLYLTPYIESGNIEEGQNLAKITEPLDGLKAGEQPEMYSGFLTVNPRYDSNMFFWFIPATVSLSCLINY